MTITGCSKGNPNNPPVHNNLAITRVPEFAEYLADVLLHFKNDLNVTFTTIAPFNEPQGLLGIGAWLGNVDSSQEGCNMNLNVMKEVLIKLHETLKSKEMLDWISISAPDETSVNTAIQTMNYLKTENVLNLMTKINVHGYWNIPGTRRDILSMMSAKQGLKLWMDEM